MLCHWKLGNLLEAGDEVTIEITNWWVQVKELGIKFVYEEDEDENGEVEEMNDTAVQPNNTTYLSWTERNLFELSDFHDRGTMYNFHQEIDFALSVEYKLVGWHGYKVSY